MDNRILSLLSLFSFKRSLSKESRLINLENLTPDSARLEQRDSKIVAVEKQIDDSKQRVTTEAAEKREEATETGSTELTKRDEEKALTAIETADSAKKQKEIFDALLAGNLEIGGKKVDIQKFTPEDFDKLFTICYQSPEKDHFLTTLASKIIEGAISAYYTNKKSLQILFTYFDTDAGKETLQKIFKTISEQSATRTSELIQIVMESGKDDTAKKEYLGPKFIPIENLKKLLFEFSEKFSPDTIIELINLELIKLDEIIDRLSFVKKIEILKTQKLKNDADSKKIIENLAKNIETILKDESALASLVNYLIEFPDKFPEVTKKIINAIAKSPKTLSILIAAGGKKPENLEKLLKTIDGGYTAILKKFITEQSQEMSTDALLVLINNWQTFLSKTSGFYIKEVIKTLPLGRKVELMASNKITATSSQDYFLDAVKEKTADLIKQPALLKQLFEADENLKKIFIGESLVILKKDPDDFAEYLTPYLATEIFRSEAFKALPAESQQEIANNLSEETSNYLQDHALDVEKEKDTGIGEDGLLLLTSEDVEEMSDKEATVSGWKLERQGEGFRRRDTDGTLDPATYSFKSTEEDKIFRKYPNGLIQSASIAPSVFSDGFVPFDKAEWEDVQAATPEKPPVLDEILRSYKYALVKTNTQIYDEKGKLTNKSIREFYTIGSETKTIGDIVYVAIKDRETPMGYMRLSDITPAKDAKMQEGYYSTKDKLKLFGEDGKPTPTIIDKEKRVTLLAPYTKTIEGTDYVKVKYHEEGKEGWVEKAMLGEYTIGGTERSMDKAERKLRDDFFPKCLKIEKTTRTIKKDIYHVAQEPAIETYHSGSRQKIKGVKFDVTDGTVYKITEPAIDEKDPTKVIFRDRYVVKFENVKTADNKNAGVPEGYIDVDYLIAGGEATVQADKHVPYEKTEWSEKPEYLTNKSIPEGEYNTKDSMTSLLGWSESNPEEVKSLKPSTKVNVIDERIRKIKIGKGDKYKEYVNVEITEGEKKTTGWILLESIQVNEAALSYVQTAKTVERQDIEMITKKEVLHKVDNQENTYAVDFIYPTGHAKAGQVNTKLENDTKLSDIFPTAVDGDTLTITHNGTERTATFYHGTFYYVDAEGARTAKRAIIHDGDTIKYTKTTEEIRVLGDADDNGYRPVNFTNPDGTLNEGRQQNARIRDLLDTSILKDGDKVLIIRSGKKKPLVAVYIENDNDGGNFYFTEAGKERGKRAPIFDGDKIKFEPKEETVETKKEIVGQLELPKKDESISKYVQRIYEKFPEVKKAAERYGYTEQEYYAFLIDQKAADRFHMQIIMPTPRSKVDDQRYRAEKSDRDIAYTEREYGKAQRALEQHVDTMDKSFDLNADLLDILHGRGPSGEKYDGISDERWNDLWERRGEFKDKYIKGLEKVINILEKNFGLSKIEIRDSLRSLLQIGLDSSVDFDDVFYTFCRKMYVEKYKEYHGEDTSSWSKDVTIFGEDLREQGRILAIWDTGGKKEKKKEVEEFYKYDKKMKLAEKRATEDGTIAEFRKTPEYREWVAKTKSTLPLRQEYEKDYVERSKYLNFLVYNILLPSTELLEAIEALEIGTSAAESPLQKYRKEIDRAKETKADETPTADAQFYSFDQLITQPEGSLVTLGEPVLKKLTERGRESYAVTALPIVSASFKKVATECGITTAETFKEDQILKLIFQLYSLKTLTSEGCLKKISGKDNQLVLTNLPKNFKKDTPEVKALFETVVKTPEDIDKKRDQIREKAESLDETLKIMKKLSTIFGKDAQKVFLHWTEVFGKALREEDYRELEITMSDIAGGAVTDVNRGSAQYFLNHMSGEAAMEYVISKITETKGNIETLNKQKLETILKENIEKGLALLPILSYRSEELKPFKEKIEEKGELTDPKVIEEFQKNVTAFLNNDTPLTEDTLTLIRLGQIGTMLGMKTERERKETTVENPQEGKEEVEYTLSEKPEIRIVQELMIAKRKERGSEPYTQDEMTKIESACLFSAGIAVGSSGETGGAGLGTSFYLGDGWSLSVGGGLGSSKGELVGGGGISVEKTIQLSKDGHTQLILGVDAGYPAVGGHAGIKFAITEDWSMSVMAAGGWSSVVGGYAAVGVGFKKEAEWERQAKSAEAQTAIGADLVEKLIKEGQSDSVIANAIRLLPRVGKKFEELQTKYGVSDKGLIEFYRKEKASTEGEISKSIEGKGWGASAGVAIIPEFPWVIPYAKLEIPVASKMVVYRVADRDSQSLNSDSQKRADEAIEADIKKRYGAEITVEFMETPIENNGQFAYDVIDGPKVRDGKAQEINFKDYDDPSKLNEDLNKINIALETDRATGLTRIQVNATEKRNLKIVIDPIIKEQLVLKDGVPYITMSQAADLIITRENFFPAFRDSGALGMTIVTIKKNPKRTREDIERESTAFIYKEVGKQARIEKGLQATSLRPEDDTLPSVTEFDLFKEQAKKPGLIDPARFETLKRQHDEFVKTIEGIRERKKEESKEIREGVAGEQKTDCFAEDFYKDFHTKYKELSTRTVEGNAKEDDLRNLINNYAKDYEIDGVKLGELRECEMAATLTYLMTRSFANVGKDQKAFERNLESFGEKVLTSFFKGSIENLAKLKPAIEIKSTAEEMARSIISDLRENTSMKSAPATEIMIDGNPMKISEAGLALLSLVGTEGIVGLRGTPTYNPEVGSKLLNLKQYRPGAQGMEGDIGKVLLEIMNPLDPEDNAEFMKSDLAINTITHAGIYLLLGGDKANKVAKCFESGEVNPENKEAFEQFKRIVLAIRNAELTGKRIITSDSEPLKPGDIPEGYKITIASEPVTAMAVYQQCGNPTIAYRGSYINILRPRPVRSVGEEDTFETITPFEQEKVFTIGVGFSFIPERDNPPTIPPPGRPPKENAPAVGADATGNGTGASMAGQPADVQGDTPTF